MSKMKLPETLLKEKTFQNVLAINAAEDFDIHLHINVSIMSPSRCTKSAP
jgi:hypothetical protein